MTTEQAKLLQHKYGKNEILPKKKKSLLVKSLHIICEPMFLLLIAAATIYFFLGEPRDGAIMLVFVAAVIGIEIMQQWKTDKTLNALKDLSAPHICVIRDGEEQLIASEDLVPGDLMIITEGVKIPADGTIVKANDLCVDESSLTGEAEGVWKIASENSDTANRAGASPAPTDNDIDNDRDYWRKDYCYAGTLVIQGGATVLVDKIGAETEFGKIGVNVAAVNPAPTPLQRQTASLVKLCSVIAAILFLLTAALTYFNLADYVLKERIVASILSGITLAMAMIPEEFPVILTVFMSMGAWRLAKKNSLVRSLPSVETLGAVSVLCVDKTGTITMNKMTVSYTWADEKECELESEFKGHCSQLVEIMGLACETDAYDPMEIAMLDFCEQKGFTRGHLFGGELISEYAFTNELKMMGHAWHHDDEIIVAVKGSPENVLGICELSAEQRKTAEDKIHEMSQNGLRVIAIAMMKPHKEEDIPDLITDCKLTFCGLVGLADPPRESVKNDILNCTKAGIRVVMITGDNGITASAIAKQIGMPNAERIIKGKELSAMSDAQLCEKVRDVSIFSRVLPEHKMRIVKAFKDNGEIVAMTGDGVNDAPALKSADIGIAMGLRGSEVSREAADLILMDDNFSTIVDTVRDGRRIYDNIRKAVGYIFTIHIPIAFAALAAPFLGVDPANLLFLPLHVVLLELIIDPTCSIVLERQPAEHNIMQRSPRRSSEKILTAQTLAKSVIQGLVILAASFGTYYFTLIDRPDNPALARTMGLTIIMLANLFLVQVNSSDYDSCVKSFRILIKDRVMWAVHIATIAAVFLILYSPLCAFLKLAPLTGLQLSAVFVIAAVSVLWYEAVKAVKRKGAKRRAIKESLK